MATKKKTTVTEKVEEVKPQLIRYKFIANCDNINVSNVIFNNIKVVIYEVDAPNYEAASNKFYEAVLKMFNGDKAGYNKFMRAVFGDDVLVEATKVEEIKQEILVLQ